MPENNEKKCCAKCNYTESRGNFDGFDDYCQNSICPCHSSPKDEKKCEHWVDHGFNSNISQKCDKCLSSPQADTDIVVVPSPRIDYCGACKKDHGYDCPPDTEKWNENVETCSKCKIQWKKIGKSCPVCFSPAESPVSSPVSWEEEVKASDAPTGPYTLGDLKAKAEGLEKEIEDIWILAHAHGYDVDARKTFETMIRSLLATEREKVKEKYHQKALDQYAVGQSDGYEIPQRRQASRSRAGAGDGGEDGKNRKS